MPQTTSNASTAAIVFQNVAQVEDDGSIMFANWTGYSTSTYGTFQANGFIGDGPFGATSGDYDAFQILAFAGDILQVDVDAVQLGSTLDPIIDVYREIGSAGYTLVTSNDDESTLGIRDSFVQYAVSATATYFVVIRGSLASGGPLVDPFNSAS